MLTTPSVDAVINIDVKLGLDDAHTWSISFFTNNDSFNIGSDVRIFRDGELLLIGSVASYSYDAGSRVMTISGTDKTSFADQYDRQEAELATDSLTTLEDAIEAVQNGAVLSCPQITCFGFGSYNGSTQPFVDRVANSFGLNWYVNPTGAGYVLSSGSIDTPSRPQIKQAWGYSSSNDYDDRISKIYIQKAITTDNKSKITIKNPSSQSTQQVRLTNPNAVIANSGGQFPIDYFIDPWNKCFITIDVPVTNIIYNQAVDIGSCKQVTVVSCSDGQASPAWHLELWDANPGPNNANANRLALLAVGQTWTANNDNNVARYARVAKTVIDNGAAITDYPHYDGVEITAYTWAEIPGSAVEAWEGSFESGDVGRPDYNVISDEMFPNYNDFVNQNLGQQIAKRDSITANKSFLTPGTPALSIKSGYGFFVDDLMVGIPATNIQYVNSLGAEQTVISGEW